MTDAFYLGEIGFRLLSDTATVAATSNTRRVLVRKVAEVLSRHLAIASFELGSCSDERAQSAMVSAVVGEREREEATRRLNAELARIIREGSPVILNDVVTLPLLNPETTPGYARITFSSPAGASVFTPPLAGLFARILGVAQSHCRLIERVAKMSSTAHHESRQLREELRKHIEPGNIVARSESMRKVLESVNLVALHDTTVLLRGESGTGKELLARRIHQLSRRSRQPFISVNCGALPETLIESELFGHEKGAFTGAVGRYRGRFERANNSTLFLDEVAELPVSAQVKLLRVLQEGEFERLGGEETIRVNVRVVTATNRALEEMTAAGAFRLDLFYRINVFPIVIPPLRDRPEDLPVLARTVLSETAKRLGCRLPPIGSRAMETLLAHTWPGNVRELANTLERALIMSQGKELEMTDLPSPPAPTVTSSTQLTETFADGARRTIQTALEACGGKIYGKHGAAARLGIPPSTLQGKMRRLHLKRR
jgi:formate hydrogenlyase transcriptional activator